MFNFKNDIPEDQTMKIKNALTIVTETCNINDLHVISEYNNERFSKLIRFSAKEELPINAFLKMHHQPYSFEVDLADIDYQKDLPVFSPKQVLPLFEINV